MKIHGPLPELKPTPHHPDEVSPGQLRLAPARVEAACADHDSSPFASPDLLRLTRDLLNVVDDCQQELHAAAVTQAMAPTAIAPQIDAGVCLWQTARPTAPEPVLAKVLDRLVALASFTEEPIRAALAAWADRAKRQTGTLAALVQQNVARDREVLAPTIAASGLSEPAFWFVFRNLGAAVLPAFAAPLAPHVPDEKWLRGRCPICGNEPAMAALVGDGGRRHLHCDTCGMVWTFARLRCPYCDNQEVNSLAVLNLDDQSPYQLDVCKKCQRYVKTIDYRKADPHQAVLLPVEDAATMFLDLMAAREGYHRE
jgi:formate dehydrogenase accessory protein FdhE